MVSSNKRNIDQLFKQKLEDFELSSQDTSWRMLQMVKESSLRKKRIRLVKTIFESLFFMATAATLLFTSLNPLTKEHAAQYIKKKKRLDIRKTEANVSPINKNFSEVQKKETALGSQNGFQYSSTSSLMNKNQPQKATITASVSIPQLKIEKVQISSSASTIYKNKTNKTSVQRIKQANINSSYDDYAPVINKKGLFMFFTSRRPQTKKEKRKGKGKERIYYSESSSSGWTKAKLLEQPLNSSKTYNSAVSISHDGQHLFIYRDDRYGNGDIYESHLKGTHWSEPAPLPSPINSEFHESTVSLTSDRNTIYFTSNRDGGEGGMDIWCAHKNKAGMWGEAKNLGKKINTEQDEEGIFIHPDGKTLYFSSRGHNGYGGYDIFYSTLENEEWSTPKNLGSTINTNDDDVYFVLSDNGKDAFYSSVNPSTPNKKDIFKIKNFNNLHKVSKSEESTTLSGNVLSKKGNLPLKADIKIYNKDTQQWIDDVKCESETGSFTTTLTNHNYIIYIYKEGFLYFKKEIDQEIIKSNKGINTQVLLDPLRKNAQFTLLENIKEIEAEALTNATKMQLDELNGLMKSNQQLKIQLLLQYNSRTHKSAESIKSFMKRCILYLNTKGIDRDRIERKVIQNKNSKENKTQMFVNIKQV